MIYLKKKKIIKLCIFNIFLISMNQINIKITCMVFLKKYLIYK